MARFELIERAERQLRTMRDAGDQKAAVAWMRDAYLVIEAALRELKASERNPAPHPASADLQLVATGATRVYCTPTSPLRTANPRMWWPGQTTIYADQPLPASRSHRAWTRRDTLRLAGK